VTIQVVWPSSQTKVVRKSTASRVVPAPTNDAVIVVEAFVGNTLVGTAKFNQSEGGFTQSGTMSLPLSSVTFFANEYASPWPAGHTYSTNPATGEVLDNGAAIASSDSDPPIARALTSVNLTAASLSTPITFTLNNAIASFALATGASASIPLNGGAVNLNAGSLISALDANGAVVLYNPSDLTFAFDPTDPQYVSATSESYATLTSAGSLTPVVVGTVHVKVTDTNVNSASEGQANISSSLTVQIVNATTTTASVGNADLVSNTPAYARSVTLEIDQQPLNSGSPANNPDNPPSPVISAPAAVTFASPLTIGTVSATITPTGRSLTYKIKAWSEPNGQGVLIAETDASMPSAGGAYSGTLFASTDYKITGFSISPATETLDVPNSSNLPTTAQLSVYLVANGSATGSAINPNAVTWHTSNSAAVTVTNGALAAVGFGTANITVADDKFPSTLKSIAPCAVTINTSTPGFSFN
jgi:hypothetical protein